MEKKWIITIFFVLALSTVALVSADNSTNINDTDYNTTQEDYAINKMALDVRYDHLSCKVNFTNGQIDVLKQYVSEDNKSMLLADKNTLNDDMDTLGNYNTADNKTAFNDYLELTFRPDFQKTTQDLNNIKKNFKTYNLSNTTKTEIKTQLTTLKSEYDACVSDKETKMAKTMERHMQNWDKQWENNIDRMTRKGFNTTQLDELKKQIEQRNADLAAIIASGNVTKMKEFMDKYRELSMQYATKFEVEKLKQYKVRLDNESKKYNKTGELDNINKKIHDAEKYLNDTEKQHRNNSNETKQQDKDFENSWKNIMDANKEMKTVSKDLLMQRNSNRPGDNKSPNNRGPNSQNRDD